jgi:hypothetical protein
MPYRLRITGSGEGGQGLGEQLGQAAEVPRSVSPDPRFQVGRITERFSSGDFAGLKDVDGFGELPGAPGAAAQLAQDVPGLEPMPLSLSGDHGSDLQICSPWSI